MKNRRLIKIIALVLFIVVSNLIILNKVSLKKPTEIYVNITAEADKNIEFQFFYSYGIYDVEHCQTVAYNTPGKKKTLQFTIPAEYTDWRIDFGEEAANIKVYEISISNYKSYDIKNELLNSTNELKDIAAINSEGEFVAIEAKSGDPQCIFGFDDNFITSVADKTMAERSKIFNIICCIVLDLVVAVVVAKREPIVEIAKDIKSSKKLVFQLAKNDFKTKYVGTYLGIIWAFVQPVVTILVYWFVFGVGLKSGDVGNVPFVLWLVAGLVPWFFFSDALSAGTSTLVEYQYLVKKVVFKISILPVVKILSALFVHVFFMLLTIGIAWGYGYRPDLYTLQILYYSLCTFVMALALVYFTCAVVVFFRDTSQFVLIFLQVGVWMTPILWQVSILPRNLLWIFKAMPMFYIVSGYRDALIYKEWFWNNPYGTIYFWIVMLILLGIGMTVFKKLKVHFADVL